MALKIGMGSDETPHGTGSSVLVIWMYGHSHSWWWPGKPFLESTVSEAEVRQETKYNDMELACASHLAVISPVIQGRQVTHFWNLGICVCLVLSRGKKKESGTYVHMYMSSKTMTFTSFYGQMLVEPKAFPVNNEYKTRVITNYISTSISHPYELYNHSYFKDETT